MPSQPPEQNFWRAAQNALPGIIAGLVIGVLSISLNVSFAALVFSGSTGDFLSQGIGIFLFSGLLLGLAVNFLSSQPYMLSVPQDSPAAILAVIALSIAQNMTERSSEQIFATIIATIILSSLLAGLVFWLVGHFNLGRLVRFIPYPVVGGFIGGTGWLLVQGGIGVMSGLPFDTGLLRPEALLRWLPGFLFGFLLMVLLRRYSHFLLLPGLLLGGIGLFYLVFFLSTGSLDSAGPDGWLLGPFPEGGVFQFLTLTAITQANWRIVFSNLIPIGTISVVSTISMLLNISGIEIASGENADLNQELKAVGVGNLLAGLGGCPPGYHSISESMLALRLGGHSRIVGLIATLLLAPVLFLGATALSVFPKAIAGGILIFLGLSFLVEWVYDAWFKLSKIDYALIWLILITVVTVGYLEGVGVGILVAIVLFVIEYSQVNVIRHAVTAANFRSSVMRPRLYGQLLRQKGDSVSILELQGFIFFGTADRLVEQIRARIEDPQQPDVQFLLLDFRLVTGVDASATFSFFKLKQLTQNLDIRLVFTGLTPEIYAVLETDVFADQPNKLVKVFPVLDQGVSWCEEQMIAAFTSVGLVAKPKTMFQRLADALPKPNAEINWFDFIQPKRERGESPQTKRLMKYFEKIETDTGTCIVNEGETISGIYFVEKGQITAQSGGQTEPVKVFRSMQAGTAFGEIDFYADQKALADYVVSQPGELVYICAENLQQMEHEDPELAHAFYRLIAGNLSKKLIQTNDTVRALQN